VWCIVLAVLLLGVSGTWFLAYRNGWWFYNEDYLTRRLDSLAETYFADFRERIVAESGLEAATTALERMERNGGMTVMLGDIFIGRNASETTLRERFVERAGCDQRHTVANMIPRYPYGANDVEISVRLVCRF